MVGGLQSGRSAAAPGRDASGWPTGPGCCPTRTLAARRMRDLLRRQRRWTVMTARPDAAIVDRLSLNTGDHQALDPARGGRRLRPGRHPGDRPVARAVAEVGARDAPRGSIRDAGLRVSLAVPRRLLHRGRPAEQRPRAGRQPARDRRGRDPRHRRAGPGRRRAARRRPRPRRRPAAGRRRARRPGAVRRRARRPAGARAAAPDVLPPTGPWSPPSARPSTSPRRYPAEQVGVVVDTFHVWWDPELAAQIARAGREDRIAAYQVCDWNLPARRRTRCWPAA